MTIDRVIFAFAGFMILLTLSLGVTASPLFVSENWLWFTAFVGLNLFQSAFTGFCPLSNILSKFGVNASCPTR